MPELAVDCAFCSTKSVGAVPHAAFAYEGQTISMYATCNRCRAGMVVYGNVQNRIGLPRGRELLGLLGHDELLPQLSITRVAPEPAPLRQIGNVPHSVGSAFREGEENRRDGRWLSAAGNYRTALDRAMKHLHPDLTGTLYAKIEALAKKNALPDALIVLMHEIRFLGNNIHEMEDPDQADVLAGAEFSALLLTYLYEMPARVEAARARRTAAGG